MATAKRWAAGRWFWLHPFETMIVLAPGAGIGGVIPVRLYMRRSETDWSLPGSVMAWDGNRHQPTLEGSILVEESTPPWHVYMRAGEFVAAVQDVQPIISAAKMLRDLA